MLRLTFQKEATVFAVTSHHVGTLLRRAAPAIPMLKLHQLFADAHLGKFGRADAGTSTAPYPGVPASHRAAS